MPIAFRAAFTVGDTECKY